MNNTELEYFENRKQKENIILFIVTCYSFGMMIVSLILRWPLYIPPVICAGVLSAWIMCFLKYKDFQFRANILAFISMLDFTMYAVRAGSLFDILTPMAAVCVLLGITALPEVLRLVNIDTIFLMLYHILVRKSVPFSTDLDKCRACLIVISIILVEGVTYILMKNQQKMMGQMQKIINDLKVAENSKSDFLSNVSHEIRTPINVISGISEMLLMEELSPKTMEDVHDIQNAGRNLHRIVNDILDFTELQSGNIELVESTYNITSTINDAMNMAAAQLENKNIEFIVDCDMTLPRGLVGDEQKIRRVLMNILSNAAKFTERGGIFILISYRKEAYGINLLVSVKDTGIGMKEEELEKLFCSFNQADTRKNRKENGLGLGLAISKTLVEKMNGFIQVESQWQKGTVVQFVIPQKVVDYEPIIELHDVKKKEILSYFNLEKYEDAFVRNSYTVMFRHLAEQLQASYLESNNLERLKRQARKGIFTHILIGWEEYCEDPTYFEEQAKKIPVLLIANHIEVRNHMEKLQASHTLQIFKPFYALSIVSSLNGESLGSWGNEAIHNIHFTAPDAAVLVVDDNLMNLKVVEGLLRPYQIRVFTAESGKEALEKIERGIYDLVFMDHMMPEMDGVETLHRIREKAGNYFKTVPIVALTANAVGGAREMFLQEGFQDFVSKPIEMPVMERVLARFIPEKKKKLYSELDTTDRMKKVDLEDQKVTDMGEIDLNLGIAYSGGSLEDYKDIVKIYCLEGRKKIDEIQTYFECHDWKNYTILVHAVKSNSKGIGAILLSEQAKDLEAAGKEQQETYIMEHHDIVMAHYRDVMDKLEREFLEEKRVETGQQITSDISAEVFLEKIRELREKLDTFEIEDIKPLVNELKNCSYQGKSLTKLAEEIAEKTEAFDFLGAGEKLQELENEMRWSENDNDFNS